MEKLDRVQKYSILGPQNLGPLLDALVQIRLNINYGPLG